MIELITPHWAAPPSVRAYTTTRAGGFSTGNYEGLNLGIYSGDDDENVLKNRDLIEKTLNLPEHPRWLTQIHGNKPINALEIQGCIEADASYTQQPGVVCTILTADCLPILLCNQEGTEVAAIHAGWKGLASNIVANTISQMQSKASELMAWIGPAISVECYEIGTEVKQAFTNQNSAYEAGFKMVQNKLHADLNALAHIQLSLLSIKNVYSEKLCTYTDEQRFYSARRNGFHTGRMASLIWLTKEN